MKRGVCTQLLIAFACSGSLVPSAVANPPRPATADEIKEMIDAAGEAILKII